MSHGHGVASCFRRPPPKLIPQSLVGSGLSQLSLPDVYDLSIMIMLFESPLVWTALAAALVPLVLVAFKKREPYGLYHKKLNRRKDGGLATTQWMNVGYWKVRRITLVRLQPKTLSNE